MIWLIRHLHARLQQFIGLYFRNKRINRAGKPKCTVVAWNLSHNPVGRAFLFADFLKPEYDTKLVGPIFPQYGERLWKPLRGYPLDIESFIAKDFPDFWNQAEEFAKNQEPVDLVIICKPRLPSILIGLLIAKKNDANVILDIDDHELSFFENRTPLSAKEIDKDDPTNLLSPHSESWTRYCESLIADFPNRTVSNLTLKEKFGGTIIPHVRDELFFNPWLYNRKKIREKYGYGKKDKVILFLGTPRSHKGFMQIPEAIKKLNNPNYKVCLIGKVRGDKMKGEMDLEQYDFIQTITDIKFAKLPHFLMIADLICLLQDVDSLVSKYQIPAKLSDALMMGIPVIASQVEPIKPLAQEGYVEILDSSEKLEERIEGIFSGNGSVGKPGKESNLIHYSRVYEIFKTMTHYDPGHLEKITSEIKEMIDSGHQRYLVDLKEEKQKIDSYIENLPIPKPTETPLVSIIVLTHNGLDHLKRLITSISKNTKYPSFEILIVDNNSSDGTLDYLDLIKNLPLKVVRNNENKSFSQANNKAVSKASGELILFLNNDIEVTAGWLTRLVAGYQNVNSIGALGCRLIYPFKENFRNSLTYQHLGIGFEEMQGFHKPINLGKGEPVEYEFEERTSPVQGVTGACLLTDKELFLESSGFDEAYNYGYEDVDLCLKLLKIGKKNYIQNDCLLYHYEFGSQEREADESVIKRRTSNWKFFQRKWDAFLQTNRGK